MSKDEGRESGELLDQMTTRQDAGVKGSTNAEAQSSTRTEGLGCVFDQEP
jgi:hypothetical protein